MITLEQADTVVAAAKRLRDLISKHAALNNKAPDFMKVSQKQFNAHGVKLTWLAMEIDKASFSLHSAVVKAGICAPYEDAYYGVDVHRPSAFQQYNFVKKHPLKD